MDQNHQLVVRDIKKSFNKNGKTTKVLDGVSLEVFQNEFLVILGPGRCGKSTLLNIFADILKPDSGSLEFTKALSDDLNPEIGMVYQRISLMPWLTVMKNVEFIMNLQKWNKKKRDQRTYELLKAVGLEDRIHSRPSKLSGGQQQRVAVARALASKPKFVLADEPTANLDSKSTETLLDIMEQLNREEGITFIFSTHDARVVKKARRVVTLEDGKVISDDRK